MTWRCPHTLIPAHTHIRTLHVRAMRPSCLAHRQGLWTFQIWFPESYTRSTMSPGGGEENGGDASQDPSCNSRASCMLEVNSHTLFFFCLLWCTIWWFYKSCFISKRLSCMSECAHMCTHSHTHTHTCSRVIMNKPRQ